MKNKYNIIKLGGILVLLAAAAFEPSFIMWVIAGLGSIFLALWAAGEINVTGTYNKDIAGLEKVTMIKVTDRSKSLFETKWHVKNIKVEGYLYNRSTELNLIVNTQKEDKDEIR